MSLVNMFGNKIPAGGFAGVESWEFENDDFDGTNGVANFTENSLSYVDFSPDGRGVDLLTAGYGQLSSIPAALKTTVATIEFTFLRDTSLPTFYPFTPSTAQAYGAGSDEIQLFIRNDTGGGADNALWITNIDSAVVKSSYRSDPDLFVTPNQRYKVRVVFNGTNCLLWVDGVSKTLTLVGSDPVYNGKWIGAAVFGAIDTIGVGALIRDSAVGSVGDAELGYIRFWDQAYAPGEEP